MTASFTRRRILIVHNPQAGRWRRGLLRDVCRRLEDEGAELRIEPAASIEQGGELARSAVETGGFDAVVAAGGDSTIRGVASALIGSTTPLGIIPVGTGNVLAHELGIHRGPEALANYLLRGRSVRVRCGLADGTPFLTMVGVGYDADVLLRLDTAWKRSAGRLAYAWPIIREIFRKPRPFDVVVDGRLVHATWLIATRVVHYGGSFVIAKNQTLTTEGFHAVVANTRTRGALAGLLISIALGRHERRGDVTVIPCTCLTINASGSIAAQLDGERFAPPPRAVELSDETVSLIVPHWSSLGSVGPPQRRRPIRVLLG